MITISHPVPQDSEGINEVIKQSWYATYITPEIGITKKDIDLMYAQSEKQQIEVFRNRAKNPKNSDISYVAKEDELVVGFLRIIILDDHIRMRAFYVRPNFTGKGIGTNLWKEALKNLPKNKPVVAWPAEHTKSIEFYKKLGFKTTAEKLLDDEVMQDSKTRMTTVKMVFMP